MTKIKLPFCKHKKITTACINCIKSLEVRLSAAEDVIKDAEQNLGVVNPLLVDTWRDIAGLPPTEL